MSSILRAAFSSVVACLLLGSIGCGGKKKPDPSSALWQADNVEVSAVGAVGTFVEPTKTEQGIGLYAGSEPDGTVVLSIRNGSKEPLDLQPRQFAVITGAEKTDLVPVSFASADLTRFSPEQVPAKGTTVVAFRMLKVTDPRGMRVVMHEPTRNLMFFVDIE